MTLRDSKSARPRTFAFARREYGAPDSRLGVHVLKRRPGLAYVRPTWEGTETVIRILPGIDTETGGFEPTRVSEEMGRYGNWHCCYEAVRRFGDPGITMLLHDGTNLHYNAFMQNPCWILYRAIKDACDKGTGRPEWFPLLNGADKRGATLSRPTEIVLVQAVVLRHNSKDQYGDQKGPYGLNDTDPTVIFEFSKSLAENFFNHIDECDPNDPHVFRYGDPVSIEDGVFVHMYERGTDPNPKLTGGQKPQAGWAAKGGNQPRKGRGDRVFGYDVHLSKTLDGQPGDIPAALNGYENKVRAKVKPWGEVLEFLSDTEQAHLINPLFPASAILYAFRDKKDWILEDTKKAATGAVSVGFDAAEAKQSPAWQAAPATPQQPDMMAMMGLMQKAMSGDAEAVAQLQTMGFQVPGTTKTPEQAAPIQTPSSRPSWGPTAGSTPVDVAVPATDIPDEVEFKPSYAFAKEPEETPATGSKMTSAQALQAARDRANARGRNINS